MRVTDLRGTSLRKNAPAYVTARETTGGWEPICDLSVGGDASFGPERGGAREAGNKICV